MAKLKKKAPTKSPKKPAAKKAAKAPKPTIAKVAFTFTIGREKFALKNAAPLTHGIIDALHEGLGAVPAALKVLQGIMLKRDQQRLMRTIKAWQKANPRPVAEPAPEADVPAEPAPAAPPATPEVPAPEAPAALEGDEPTNVEPDHEPTNEQ